MKLNRSVSFEHVSICFGFFFHLLWAAFKFIASYFRTNEVQQELHEFRECSEEIEKELETQLEQNEKQMKDLRQQNTSMTFELETIKVQSKL